MLTAAATTALLSTHEQAELHYWAGLAQYRNGDIERCLAHYNKAIEAYRLTGVGPGRGIGLLYIVVGALSMLQTAVSALYARLRLVDEELQDVMGDASPA